MEPGKRYAQKVETSFHISMAAFDVAKTPGMYARFVCFVQLLLTLAFF